MWRTVFTVTFLLSSLAGCMGYLAYMYRPDLAEQPSDQSKYRADLRVCQDKLLARPDSNTPFVPFSLSGSGAAGAAQDGDAIDDAQETINHCMAEKGYRIKQRLSQS